MPGPRARSLTSARLAALALALSGAVCLFGAEPTASPSAISTPAPQVSGLAPYEQRLRAAKSVKVMTSVLGIEVGTKLADAHAKLDKLSEGGKATKEETEEEEGEAGARKSFGDRRRRAGQ